MLVLLVEDGPILPCVMVLSEFGAGKKWSSIKMRALTATQGMGSLFTVKMKFWAESAKNQKGLEYFALNGAPVMDEAPTSSDLERLAKDRPVLGLCRAAMLRRPDLERADQIVVEFSHDQLAHDKPPHRRYQ